MSVPLIRDKVQRFMYPDEEQVQLWRAMHEQRLRRAFGSLGVFHMQPFCFLCRLREVRRRRRLSPTDMRTWRGCRQELFRKFDRYVARLSRYLLTTEDPCEHRLCSSHYICVPLPLPSISA